LPPCFLAAVTDPWPKVDDQLDATARRHELELALESLTEAEREVLLLVAWEQLSQAEIAFVLGIPPGTVRSRLHRARAVMRGELAVGNPAADDRLLKEN
jgi:RNA polymerase sigma-70 factor (ECF subfamily)